LSVPKRFSFFKKRPFYSGNLNSETPGDNKNAFLHCGDVLDAYRSEIQAVYL